MNPPLEALPNDPVALQEIITSLQARMSHLHGQHEHQVSILLEQIRHLRQQLFGKRSERLPVEASPVQLPLFDLPEPERIEPAKVPVEPHSRRKPGRKPLPPELPRLEVIHDLPEEEKVCACGCALSRIGEEVSEQLDIIPARIQVLRHIRPKYACRGCEGVEDEGPAVRIVPMPPQIIPQSIVSPGLLAHVLTAKFVDHLPLYRQEQFFARLGVEIGRATMSNWAMRAAEACVPLLNLIHDEILAGKLINIDETTLQVLAEPGRAPTATSYMWLFRRGDPQRPALLYQYHPTRAGDVARTFLGDYRGIVQTDGFSGYDFLDRQAGVRHAGCWAHVRRKFMEVVRAQGKNRTSGSADQALAYIQQLYGLEKEARGKNWRPEAISGHAGGKGSADPRHLSPVAAEAFAPDSAQGVARQGDQLCPQSVGPAGGLSRRPDPDPGQQHGGKRYPPLCPWSQELAVCRHAQRGRGQRPALQPYRDRQGQQLRTLLLPPSYLRTLAQGTHPRRLRGTAPLERGQNEHNAPPWRGG